MGDTDQTTTTTPWAEKIPYLKEIFSEAAGLYDQPYQFFPGETVAGRSGATAQANQMAASLGGTPYLGSAETFLDDTLSGAFMGGPGANPMLDERFGHLADQVTSSYKRAVLPGISSRFGSSGRLGSPAEMNAIGQSQEELGEALGQVGAEVYYGDYNNRMRDRMSALGLAPSVRGMRYGDIGQQRVAGASEESLDQRRIDEAIARFDFQQNEPAARLGRYAGTIYGSPSFPSQTTTSSGMGAAEILSILASLGSIGTGVAGAF